MADANASHQREASGQRADARGSSEISRLQVVTPDSVDDSTLSTTLDLLAAGVPWIQVRTKHATGSERLGFASPIANAASRSGATVVIDDRCDVALAVRAAGVHVGADDIPVADARRILGAGAIVGATVRDPDAARAAVDAGATYIGAGPAYRSTTKARGLPEPLGPAGIGRIARAVPIPVIAIAGVTADRIPELLDAGAHGVAVVAAIYGSADPLRAALELLDATGSTVGLSVHESAHNRGVR